MFLKDAHTKGCMKFAYFNKPGETIEILCEEHKEEGMINVASKRYAHKWMRRKIHTLLGTIPCYPMIPNIELAV